MKVKVVNFVKNEENIVEIDKVAHELVVKYMREHGHVVSEEGGKIEAEYEGVDMDTNERSHCHFTLEVLSE